ncbi:hypothetical protein C8R47DRAFT_1220156 [Mycena vitilis]|nr:hypothetical protein C8R47DRAFT_1220156 [Mycena vitilis]
MSFSSFLGVKNPEINTAYNATLPPMGIYHTVAFSMMEGRPYDAAWDFVFSTMEIDILFQVSQVSLEMNSVVMGFVNKHWPDTGGEDELRTGHEGDYISKVPVDAFPLIFARLGLRDALSLARTSKKFSALHGRHRQYQVNCLLLRYRLSYIEFRFMQTATRAVISGPALAQLFGYDTADKTLHVYTPDFSYSAVLRFFDLTGSYHRRGPAVESRDAGIDHTTTFSHGADGCRVAVHRSQTDSSLDLITYFPFTHMFFAVTHYGWWMGYPHTTSRRISIPNREGAVLLALEGDKHLWESIHQCVSQYRVHFQLFRQHTCGLSFECPATLRNTMDEGCLHLFFPHPPMGGERGTRSVYPTNSAMSWTLGAGSCPDKRKALRQDACKRRSAALSHMLTPFSY